MTCTHDRARYREYSGVETHGLDCGPYERWTEGRWECPDCNEWFTEQEMEREMAEART